MQNFSFLGYIVQKITGYCKFAVPPQDGGFRTPPQDRVKIGNYGQFMKASVDEITCLRSKCC